MGIRLERAAGPLAEHRPGYQAELERLGYTRNTVKHHLVVVSQLDRYLLAEGAAPGAVDEELIGRFVAARTEENLASCRSPRMLASLLSNLRRLGAVRRAVPAVPGSRADAVVAGWRQYLLAERGMTPAAVRGYTDVVRPFLAARDDGGCVLLDGLGAAEISAFMLYSAHRFATKMLQMRVSAPRRSFSYGSMQSKPDTDKHGSDPSVP